MGGGANGEEGRAEASRRRRKPASLTQGVMRCSVWGRGRPGRELGHLPQIPRRVQNYVAADLSGWAQLTEPHRASHRLLPAQRWAPLRLRGVTPFPLWLEVSRESPEWMGRERWGERLEVPGLPEATRGGRTTNPASTEAGHDARAVRESPPPGPT